MRLNVKTKNAAALSLFNKNVYKSLVTRDYFEIKTYLLRPKSWVILQERHGYCQEAVRGWLRQEIKRTFRWQGGKDENTGSIAVATLRMFLVFSTRPTECAA
jgi:hypothetical protein